MTTLEQIFQRVKTHLLTQNAKSMHNRKIEGIPSSTAQCVYRSPDGLKCAVGCLIADEHYKPELEGLAALGKAVSNALIASGIPMNDHQTQRLVSYLQRLHDDYEPKEWAKELDKLEPRIGNL